MNWAKEQRLLFIATRLANVGYINRADIQAAFHISTPQASLDLALFQQKHPDAMVYNKHRKRYETPGYATTVPHYQV